MTHPYTKLRAVVTKRLWGSENTFWTKPGHGKKGQTPQFQFNLPALLWEGKTNYKGCCYSNWVHLHIVFMLLYSVCCSVSVLLCVHVIRSFTCYVLWFRSQEKTWRQRKRKQEGRTTASHMYRQKEIKSATSGSFVVSYFQPDTSMSPFTLSMQNGCSKSDIQQTTWTADAKKNTQTDNLCQCWA